MKRPGKRTTLSRRLREAELSTLYTLLGDTRNPLIELKVYTFFRGAYELSN